jgi:protein required for attachment to host cells
MHVPHKSFVVVADGKKMLFFRNEGDEEFPKLEVERKRVQDNPQTRDQKSDD